AAGMAVSEKLKNQVRGLNQAQRNAQDGISLIQTAEGGLAETHSLLARMRELAVQSGNDTLSTSDRLNLSAEFTQLQAEITRLASTVTFNGISLLDTAASKTLQIGANSTDTLTLTRRRSISRRRPFPRRHLRQSTLLSIPSAATGQTSAPRSPASRVSDVPWRLPQRTPRLPTAAWPTRTSPRP
ncbi:MAG: hypothetical protein EBT22_05740, partial [Chloroflexi bacterium]|nr:hypothetical protein [Chloroflexota bacterium]